MQFGHVVLDIQERTDRQTDRVRYADRNQLRAKCMNRAVLHKQINCQ